MNMNETGHISHLFIAIKNELYGISKYSYEYVKCNMSIHAI